MTFLILPWLIGLAALVGRIWVPWGRPPGGLVVRRVPISLLSRLRMQALPASLFLAATVVGYAVGWLPLPAVPIALLSSALVIGIRFGYILSTEGIALGRTPRRRWTEFAGLVRRRGGVRLQGVAGSSGQTIWLSGNRDDDEFVGLMRQLVRGAYKGHVGPTTTEIPAPAEISPLRPFEQAPLGSP